MKRLRGTNDRGRAVGHDQSYVPAIGVDNPSRSKEYAMIAFGHVNEITESIEVIVVELKQDR
jgi:hypothetical protein